MVWCGRESGGVEWRGGECSVVWYGVVERWGVEWSEVWCTVVQHSAMQ